jgi:NADH-quinone oxidoreductase subunit L
MPEFLEHHPGLLFVIATLLPLASFVLLLLAGGLRNALRKSPEGTIGERVYLLLGGPAPGRGAAYVATAAIALACVCSVIGFVLYTDSHADHEKEIGKLQKELRKERHERAEMGDPSESGDAEEKKAYAEKNRKIKNIEEQLEALEGEWSGRIAWAGVGIKNNEKKPGTLLTVGFHIDSLAALMFVMVTFVATLIHIFSIGYMADELKPVVEDHVVHTAHGHLHRHGRFGRFFLFLSLFCFSMLNLVLADNLFQVFVSWELVGLCSYLLIGFYFERQSASNAANKAFITNRVGDAGFLIGLFIIWTYVGSFNFEEIFARIRSPHYDSHGHVIANGGQIVRADEKAKDTFVVTKGDTGESVVLFPLDLGDHYHGLKAGNRIRAQGSERGMRTTEEGHQVHSDYAVMPYWLLVAAGLGIFLGCVGKSAQFPLQVWLPDAMEGPTPVSALIHAATMVAAGVYLVGRVYPLFTMEALLVIAYTGAITLFVAATIALVMTDIKKVLAYSTVSQLGYMMLSLGVGGWVAGLFHLFTHAFFKALLFLGSGSVIYGCHHEQEMTKMGGLFPKMRITALTMLVGCLAIAGTPLFSGWYSKDAVVASAMGYSLVFKEHSLLFLLPLLTAGVTTFYMFRMWFMTFTGKPRDHHVYDNAHESPQTMTVPLILLAVCSIAVAWGWPVWDPESSWLELQIHHSMPRAVIADFGVLPEVDKRWEPNPAHREGGQYVPIWPGGRPRVAGEQSPRHQMHDFHALAGYLALGMALLGFVFAYLIYYRGLLDPADAQAQFPGIYAFLRNKWYFDEIYSALLVRPALAVARWCRVFDTKVIDGAVDSTAHGTVELAKASGRFDLRIVDGLVNLTARVFYGIGSWFRTFQTGYLRSYVVFLVVAAVGIWVLLYSLLGAAPP